MTSLSFPARTTNSDLVQPTVCKDRNLSPPETLIGTGSEEPGKELMNIDFRSVPSREALEEGTYLLQVAEVEEKTSSTGNPMLSITYDVLSTSDGSPVEGSRKIWDNYSLQAQALFKLKELFDALGIDTSAVVDMDVADLVGQQVLAKLVQETYNGELRNRVKKLFPVG